MLTNQSGASKVCVNCSTHRLNKVLYFCSHLDCHVVLCVECKDEHIQNHKTKETDPFLLSFPLVVRQIKERLVAATRFLDHLLDELENKDILEQNLGSICLKQANIGFEEIIFEIEGLRPRWKEYLCSIETSEASEVVKSCYSLDFQKVTRSIEENISKRAQSDLFYEIKIRQNAKGLGSVLEQVRSLCNNQSQPVQNGEEEKKSLSPKEDFSHCKTYTKRPAQLIVPLTQTNSKNPQLDREKLSNIPVSPAMTIMEDSQAESPLTGETISLSEFSAKLKSRYGQSPFSLYNIRRSEIQIDTFEMIEEEQEQRF